MLYKNKVIIKDDVGHLDIVFCKTVSDGIRFYNMLSEWSAKRKLKQIMFLGNYSEIGDKRRKLEAELMEKTGWAIRKIQMSTSKKCRL